MYLFCDSCVKDMCCCIDEPLAERCRWTEKEICEDGLMAISTNMGCNESRASEVWANLKYADGKRFVPPGEW